MPVISKVFETISMASVSTSAADARRLRFLRYDDGITMNRDRVLADAKARLLALAENYAPPIPSEPSLPGATARVALQMAVDGYHKLGRVSDYDTVIATALAEVLGGGNTDITESVDEDTLMDLERRAFMSLVKRPQSVSRIEHMLDTGKALRN
jgi:3-hydroxyacyl-CoA dehydrogenase